LTGWLLVLLALMEGLCAHDFRFTPVSLTLERDTFSVELECDLDALALGVSQDEDSARLARILGGLSQAELAERVEDLRAIFRRRVRVRFDQTPVTFQVLFPDYGSQAVTEAEIPTILGTRAELQGRIPTGVSAVSFFASRAFPPVQLRIFRTGSATEHLMVLQAGERSPDFPLQEPFAEAGRADTLKRYLTLGYRHILPEGMDHLLFVLGLFLLSTRLPPLLWQISAFTVSHTLTLALSMYGVVSLPSRLVETLIALSIVYVAIENTLTRKVQAHRLAVVFGFGLLHGLGFAEALHALGLPTGHYLSALLAFNLGVELGQLSVILLAFLLLGWFNKEVWYRRWIVVPGSCLIALIGTIWALQRLGMISP
jgi:hypothetical protein